MKNIRNIKKYILKTFWGHVFKRELITILMKYFILH